MVSPFFTSSSGTVLPREALIGRVEDTPVESNAYAHRDVSYMDHDLKGNRDFRGGSRIKCFQL